MQQLILLTELLSDTHDVMNWHLRQESVLQSSTTTAAFTQSKTSCSSPLISRMCHGTAYDVDWTEYFKISRSVTWQCPSREDQNTFPDIKRPPCHNISLKSSSPPVPQQSCSTVCVWRLQSQVDKQVTLFRQRFYFSRFSSIIFLALRQSSYK
jgi:hypothetical protein